MSHLKTKYGFYQSKIVHNSLVFLSALKETEMLFEGIMKIENSDMMFKNPIPIQGKMSWSEDIKKIQVTRIVMEQNCFNIHGYMDEDKSDISFRFHEIEDYESRHLILLKMSPKSIH